VTLSFPSLRIMRAEKDKWNATDNAQRKRLIQILQELIDQLKMEEMVAQFPRIETKKTRSLHIQFM
jgi:hypothetical protein